MGTCEVGGTDHPGLPAELGEAHLGHGSVPAPGEVTPEGLFDAGLETTVSAEVTNERSSSYVQV